MKARLLVDIPDTEVEAEAYHTWHIQKWRQLSQREQGPTFECGGQPWRVLFFPFGNNVDSVSFYLEHGFQGEPPEDWHACVQFALVLWNPRDPAIHFSHTASHRFNKKEGDWGFTRFVEMRKAFSQPWEDHERPLVENDEANITAYVRMLKDPTGVLWHNFDGYDSKKETGMVGLKNQGATCYLNSLLQSLYFTDAFRKAVYQIPTESDAVKTNSAWTLQRLFYQLQMSKLAVATSELTSSFGWDSRQIFEQQDVQELSRILMEKLEVRMKGTAAENALPQLFVGKSKTYISCIHVDFESSRIEDFWDIQLNVRGNKTLHDSFMDYIQVETLEGENKYDAGEPYKLQDAKKGVIFESFPPVLHLQLKRFEYDMNRDAMMKVNDRHEFPEEFDVSPYLSPDADLSEPWVYQLHGVLVHSGDFNAGHYYAFLKPKKDGPFYKFDDDRVTRAAMKETLEDNYGGEYANLTNGAVGHRQPYMRGYSTKRSMNAYMLVYIRKSRLDQVLIGVKETDIPPHIEQKVAEERAEVERRRKEREEAHLYLNILLISDLTFKHHHSFDITNWDAEPTDLAAPKLHRVRRAMKISEFAAEVAKDQGLVGEQIRFWLMVQRQNKTSRPDQPLRDPNMTIEEAWNRHGAKGAPFRLFAESCQITEDGKPAWPETLPTAINNVPILVFLKYFDVEAQTLTGVGHVYVRKLGRVGDIAQQVLDIMKWEPGTNFMLFEEIKYSMIEPMKPKQTFYQSEIQDGDIICFQKVLPDLDPSTVTFTDTRQYYDYLLNRVAIRFSPRLEDGSPEFTLMLSKKMTYEQFSVKVGEHLKVDPTHLRYATVHMTTSKPKNFVKRNINQTLQQILTSQYSSYGYINHRSDALFYEVLETSLADFETKKAMKVTYLSEGITKEVSSNTNYLPTQLANYRYRSKLTS
jgi:ubiquitin carboxyl-terminal hydrolase 7